MFRNLLFSAFRTLCPMVFSRTPNRIQQTIPSGQYSGSYTAPANGVVRVTGYSTQCEVNNISSGEAFSINSSDKNYKTASVFAKKGDTVNWQLLSQTGQNTAVYFYYSGFELP